MRLHLTDAETEALRLRAAHENRSEQEVTEDEMPRYSEALRRLNDG